MKRKKRGAKHECASRGLSTIAQLEGLEKEEQQERSVGYLLDLGWTKCLAVSYFRDLGRFQDSP